MKFKPLDPSLIQQRLAPLSSGTPVPVVLDTDTYNEVDDQFALAYLVRRPEKVKLLAVHAAPFKNKRVESSEQGMLRSYDEILNVLDLLEQDAPITRPEVRHGSRRAMTHADDVVDSPAVDALIEMAVASDSPLHVIAIGAVTNVASAIVKAPEIREKIVVSWLGGHSVMPGVEAARSGGVQTAREFNFQGDRIAAKLLFDCGVPLIWSPCQPVAYMFSTSVPELQRDLMGRSKLGDYLTEIVADHPRETGRSGYAWAKQIWDVVACFWQILPEAIETRVVHSPTLLDDGSWDETPDTSRHLIREVVMVRRDRGMADLFNAIATTSS